MKLRVYHRTLLYDRCKLKIAFKSKGQMCNNRNRQVLRNLRSGYPHTMIQYHYNQRQQQCIASTGLLKELWILWNVIKNSIFPINSIPLFTPLSKYNFNKTIVVQCQIISSLFESFYCFKEAIKLLYIVYNSDNKYKTQNYRTVTHLLTVKVFIQIYHHKDLTITK